MITLSERLQLELRNRDPSEITELILDNSKANEIEGLDDSYVNLRELSLVNVGLTTLKGFPSLPSVEKLDLSDNKISCGLDNLIKCPQLVQLLLTNNRVKSSRDVECLSNLKNLEILDLFNCAISSEENYRKEIFALIPTLKYLDGFDEKNEEELNESEEYDDEEENEGESEVKDAYELSDDESGSEEEYESEEEVEIVSVDHNSGKASNTRGKDMNLYPNDVVEITDEDDDEDYDGESYDEINETNGKSKTSNYIDSDCDDEVLSENEESNIIVNIDHNSVDNLPNGELKRHYEAAFNDLNDGDSPDNVKQKKNNSDFDLSAESSSTVLDKV